MPVVLCPFHSLAIFRDGNVGRDLSLIRFGPFVEIKEKRRGSYDSEGKKTDLLLGRVNLAFLLINAFAQPLSPLTSELYDNPSCYLG